MSTGECILAKGQRGTPHLNRKTLLIVSAGRATVPGLERLKEMDLHLVLSDRDTNAPGFQWADDRIIASTYDVEATVAAAREYHQHRPIDGVMSIGADVPLTVASVAHDLGLPGISLETARLASDKLTMKEQFLEDGLPIPWFSSVQSPDQLYRIAEERGFPLIIKPVDNAGARGVQRLTEEIDLNGAFAIARENSPTGRVMAEEFIPGPQISTESIISEGKSYTSGCSDRNYDYLELLAPYIIENGGLQPSFLLNEILPKIDDLIERSARSMGIRNGVVKGDIVIDPDRGPVIIELAARLSGGFFSTDQIPLSTGVDLVKVAAKLALGLSFPKEDLIPRYWHPVAIRYFMPPPGRLLAVHGFSEARAKPWIHKANLFVRPGDSIQPVTDHCQLTGYVIAVGETREEAIERAEEEIRSVRFIVDA